jgi:23S rRNA (pseudouridine1915-N3)-methyltransferase
MVSMFKVKIYSVHKTKELWLQTAISEYEKRLKPYMSIEWIILKDDKELEKKVLEETFYICLDEKGVKMTSTEFGEKLFQIKGKINFIIGSDFGLSDKIKKNANIIISLSDLTFTHQMVRLILIEQLYRAIEIYKNTKYHK